MLSLPYRAAPFRRGDDTVGSPRRTYDNYMYICIYVYMMIMIMIVMIIIIQGSEGGMIRLEAPVEQFELFEFVLLLKFDKQLPVEQFEATVSQSRVPSGVFRRPPSPCSDLALPDRWNRKPRPQSHRFSKLVFLRKLN